MCVHLCESVKSVCLISSAGQTAFKILGFMFLQWFRATKKYYDDLLFLSSILGGI